MISGQPLFRAQNRLPPSLHLPTCSVCCATGRFLASFCSSGGSTSSMGSEGAMEAPTCRRLHARSHNQCTNCAVVAVGFVHSMAQRALPSCMCPR